MPEELDARSKKKLSSCFDSYGAIVRGLSDEEERKYLPRLLSIQPTSVDWDKKTREYWCNMSFVVAPAGGTALEKGLNDKGEPINLQEYIRYRFAMAHPKVAKTQAAFNSDPETMFYIYDPVEEKQVKYDALQVKKDAFTAFMKLTQGKNADLKVDAVLRVMVAQAGGSMSVLHSNDQAAKELALNSFMENSPVKFIQTCEDPNVETRAFVEECIEANALRREGKSILFIDTVIGATTEEAVHFLNDKRNSETRAILTAKVQGALHQKRKTPTVTA